MSLLIDNIGQLVTNDRTRDGERLGIVTGAAVVVEDAKVAWIGPGPDAPAADERFDADGGAVLPGFVDSHSHPVFAGDRSAEFEARIAGAPQRGRSGSQASPYTGGGIRTTVAATRAASGEELLATASRLRAEALRQGTTTMEVKSGYGLTTADEARCLHIAFEVSPESTFLGAHVVPDEYADRPDDYVALVCGEMLAAAEPYARWVDVFCERGAFDVDQSRAVLTAGAEQGLGLRVHANQLSAGPGVRLAVELGAASADHCTYLSDADVDALAGSSTVATLLPGAEFSTLSPYPDARRLLDAGVTVALATDCNPGSSYTTSMPFCVALAVREMRMTPAEAVWAATAGGAEALRRADIGVLRPGSRADLVVLYAPSYVYLAYRPGVPLVKQVIHNGVLT